MDPLYMSESLDPQERDKFIDTIAKEVVHRHLAAPAIVLLESSKPLSFVASQTMIFFDPIVKLAVPVKNYSKFQKILEDRDNIERLITAIEKYEDAKFSKNKINEEKVNPDEKRGD